MGRAGEGPRDNPAEVTSKIRAGSRWLVGRQAAGILISLGGLVVITRYAGPADYGVYTAAFSIWFSIQSITEANFDVWLVRRNKVDEDVYSTAQVLLIAAGLVGTVVCALAAPIAARLTGLSSLGATVAALAPLTIVVTSSQVALSHLERELEFRKVGIVEVAGQLGFALAGGLLTFCGAGALGLVAALYFQQIIVAICYFVLAGVRPRLRVRRALAREAVLFAIPSTASVVVASIKTVGIQVLVGRELGATGLGIVNFTYRMLNQAAFIRVATARMSYAVFGRFSDNSERLRRAIDRALILQVIVGSIPLLVLCWSSRWMLPVVFGDRWASAAPLACYLAPGIILIGTQAFLSSALAARDSPGWALIATGTGTLLFFAVTVALLPTYGTSALALAELTTIISLSISYAVLMRNLGDIGIMPQIVTIACYGVSLQAVTWHWLLGLLALAPLSYTRIRSSLRVEMSSLFRRTAAGG